MLRPGPRKAATAIFLTAVAPPGPPFQSAPPPELSPYLPGNRPSLGDSIRRRLRKLKKWVWRAASIGSRRPPLIQRVSGVTFAFRRLWLARGGELILERESGRHGSHHRRLRAFLLSFALGCVAFLFLLEGSAGGGAAPL